MNPIRMIQRYFEKRKQVKKSLSLLCFSGAVRRGKTNIRHGVVLTESLDGLQRVRSVV